MSVSTEKVELKDFDTIFVNGHATLPFAISWSDDGKVALLVDDGVQIFELYPTPINAQLTITFLRSWIPTNTRLPFQNVLVENKGNSFIWNLKRKEVYEMAIDSTLAPLIEKSAISSYVIQCCFSPLICNECYLSCLTNNGVLEIYKWDFQRWKSVLDVSHLWIKYCNTRDGSETVDYNLLKLKIFQLKILTMSWTKSPKLMFVTGHEDGGVCLWDVEVVDKNIAMSVNRYFHIIGKPSCITMCKTNKPDSYLFFVGTLLGTLKCILLRYTCDGEFEVGNETELWKHEDFIKPVFIKCELDKDLFVFTVKNHVILIQRLEIGDGDGAVRVAVTNWHEFPSPVVSFDNYQSCYVVGTRNHEFFSLHARENDFEVRQDVEVPLKPKHSSCFHCYGTAVSQNKAIWIVASSAKVNFDAKTMKDTIHLLVLIPKVKTFKSLSDLSCTGLIKKVVEKYKSTRLTEMSDLLELKKCELLADPTNYADDFTCSLSSSPLELKLMIWETRLKIFTQSAEDHNVVSQCESMLALQWSANRRTHYLNMQSKLTPLQRRSLEVMEIFLKERKRVTEGESQCKICGEYTQVTDVKFSTCSNSHSFPRCCLSLLPCDSVPYAFCRLCESTALLEFISDNDYRCLYCDALLVPDTRVKELIPST